jgi:hypothetical protein
METQAAPLKFLAKSKAFSTSLKLLLHFINAALENTMGIV